MKQSVEVIEYFKDTQSCYYLGRSSEDYAISLSVFTVTIERISRACVS